MACMSEAAPRRNRSGLVRDIELLELFDGPESVDGVLGVSQVAALAGRDKGAVSRALATLADAGLLERVDPGYRLGARLFALAAKTSMTTLVQLARPHLRGMTSYTRETAHLCVLRGGNVLTVLSELSPHEFHTTGWEGVTTSAWRTPSGRALMSDWDDASIRRWFDEHGGDLAVLGSPPLRHGGFPVMDRPQPSGAVHDLQSLLADVERVRRTGYSISDEELELGVVAASAPVVDHTGRVIAAVNVSAPKARIGDQLVPLAEYVAKAARYLSRGIGGERLAER